MLAEQYLVNLDDMSSDHGDYTAYAKSLDAMVGTLDPSDTITAENLARYARLKAKSMFFRLNRNVGAAISVEHQMDRIYRALPDYAKW